MIDSGRPMSGLLAGNGTAMVHALVYHHPTPDAPPAALAELVDPLDGVDGQPDDWQLSMRKLLAHRDEHVHDVWSTFSAWRRTFVADRVLGDVATVRSFITWAETVGDVQSLHPLNLPAARVEWKNAPRMAWQTQQIATAARARGDLGLAITNPQRSGIVRGFVVGDEPVLLLEDRGASVSAVPDGLEIVDPKASTLPRTLLVHGWVLDTDGLTAITDEGPVSMASSAGGRLLALVAPGVTNASVGPAQLCSIFSSLMTSMQDIAQLAASDHVPVWIRTGNVGSSRYVVR
jgi:hypothetical protein